MAPLSPELKELFGRTKLVVLPEDYYLIHLPVDAKPIPGEWYRPATTRFAVFIREPDEITLIVARRKWLRMQNLFDKYYYQSVSDATTSLGVLTGVPGLPRTWSVSVERKFR